MKKESFVQKLGEALPIDTDVSMLHPAPICFNSLSAFSPYITEPNKCSCVNYNVETNSACQPFEFCSSCLGWNGEEF